MDDLISHGPEREPGRLARHAPAALMLAILIVVAVMAIGHQPGHRAARPGHPAPAAARGPVQLAGLGSGAARMLNGDRPSGNQPVRSALRATRPRPAAAVTYNRLGWPTRALSRGSGTG